jgi:hypothetical protein
MTKKQKFIEEIENSLRSEGGLSLSDEAREFFESLKNEKATDGVLTETGEKVLT